MIDKTTKVGNIVWGSRVEEPMEAVVWVAILRPDACCSSPAFRQRRSWWEMNMTGRVMREDP